MTPDDILERSQWDTFWVPDDVEVTDRQELLFLACPRDVPMLNSVTRTRATAERLPQLVAEVALAHARVRSRWLVRPRPQRPALERALGQADYAPVQEHDGYTVEVDSFVPRSSSGLRVRPVDSMEILRHCVGVMEAAFGRDGETSDADLEQYLEACAGPDARVHRFVAYEEESGAPISSGGMTFFPQLAFCYLWAGATVPEARGRGAYSAVLAARVEAARALGATRLGLYAMLETSAPIVARQGFNRHGRMTYWDRPPSAATQ